VPRSRKRGYIPPLSHYVFMDVLKDLPTDRKFQGSQEPRSSLIFIELKKFYRKSVALSKMLPNLLTPLSRVLEKLLVTQKFPAF
jgi:hypothetical protein